MIEASERFEPVRALAEDEELGFDGEQRGTTRRTDEADAV
jgi:hypothetical protein